MMKQNKVLWLIILLVLFQTVIICILNINFYVGRAFPILPLERTTFGHLSLSSLLMLSSVGLIYVLFTAARREKKIMQQELYIENLKESLNNLRAQRHDFISHLQAVYGLLQLQKSEDALEYITSICNMVRQPTRIIEVNQPVLAALLQTKAAVAESLGISFQFEINSDLKDFFLPQAVITSIFGNLLDNAVEAALAARPGIDKRIWLRIFAAGNYYCFELGNTGPVIPLEMQQKIFERGFTTKREGKENHGQGLYIVRKLVTEFNGRIDVLSSDQGTVFTIKFPF